MKIVLCKQSNHLIKMLPFLFAVFVVIQTFEVVAQERIEISLDSTKDTRCTSPASYNPKTVSLRAGYWNVRAKSGAWQPFGSNVQRYLHSFKVRNK